MANANRCAVVFDFDGTLTPKHKALCHIMGDEAVTPKANADLNRLRERYRDLAISGQLTAEQELDWLVKTVDAFFQSDLTPERMRTVLRDVALRPGVRYCLELLHQLGVPTAIVSYGAAPFIEAVLENNGVQHCIDRVYAASLSVSRKTGCYDNYDPDSVVLPVNKGDWSRRFADVHGVPYDNLIAIGDTGGDKLLGHLKERRLGIAQDEAEAAKIAPHMGEVLITEDFVPVTKWLLRAIYAI